MPAAAGDLLVAAVHRPSPRRRRVLFPPGEWASGWDAARFDRPGCAEVEAPLERIPLFQPADSSIPMLREVSRHLQEVPVAHVEDRKA